jgi:hypothetical protein
VLYRFISFDLYKSTDDNWWCHHTTKNTRDPEDRNASPSTFAAKVVSFSTDFLKAFRRPLFGLNLCPLFCGISYHLPSLSVCARHGIDYLALSLAAHTCRFDHEGLI